MFSKSTIGQRLAALAATNTVILLGVATLFSLNSGKLSDSLLDLGEVQLPVVRNMGLTDMMHDGIRAVILRSTVASFTKNVKELEESTTEFEEMSKQIGDYLNEVRSKSISDETRSQVDVATEFVGSYVEAGREIIDLNKEDKGKEALEKMPKFQAAFEDLEKRLGVLGDKIESTASSHALKAAENAKFSKWFGVTVTVVGVVLTLTLSFFINLVLVRSMRGVVRQLKEQRENLQVFTGDMQDSSNTLSSSSNQTAAAVQETASAIEEINATVKRTADNSKTLSNNAKTSREIVNNGRATVIEMINEMNQISEVSRGVMQQLDAGNLQIKNIITVIGEIGQKTKVINDIVFQTKLLSFNASVEAARAGEHGKGFSVVAEEVGNLAKMSGDSAKEISQILDQSIRQVSEIIDTNQSQVTELMNRNLSKIDEGKKVAEQCGQIFSQIVDQVESVTSLSAESSAAIQEQKSGLDEVNKAISSFNDAAQSTNLTAQRSSDLAFRLRQSFDDLTKVMEHLEQIVTGTKSGSHTDTGTGSKPASTENSVTKKAA